MAKPHALLPSGQDGAQVLVTERDRMCLRNKPDPSTMFDLDNACRWEPCPSLLHDVPTHHWQELSSETETIEDAVMVPLPASQDGKPHFAILPAPMVCVQKNENGSGWQQVICPLFQTANYHRITCMINMKP